MARTVSSIHLWQRPLGLTDQNRCLGIVLLHGGICAREKRPVQMQHDSISTIFFLFFFLREGTLCLPNRKARRVLGRDMVCPYRNGALCSDVWQNKKRTSLRVLAKAYLLADMMLPIAKLADEL